MEKTGHYFLISEYCAGPFYMGWHLYLRENTGRQQRNADGEWGWIHWRGLRDGEHPARAVFDALGICLTKEWHGGKDHGYSELARRFPIPRQRIGGKPRGCVPVHQDEWGKITLRPAS